LLFTHDAATAASIVTAGGRPVPVELGDDNLIDPNAIEAAINPRTVGIMPTQLNGRTCNMDRIMAIAEKHGLFVVEDAAQALGSKFKGKAAGTFGEAAAISFFPAKVLGCLGDGGGVISNNEHIYDLVYQFHDHGRDVHGRCVVGGEIAGWIICKQQYSITDSSLTAKLSSADAISQTFIRIAWVH